MTALQFKRMAMMSAGLIVPIVAIASSQEPSFPNTQWIGSSIKTQKPRFPDTKASTNQVFRSVAPAANQFPPEKPLNTPIYAGSQPRVFYPQAGYPASPSAPLGNYSGMPMMPQYPSSGTSWPSMPGMDSIMPSYNFSEMTPFGNTFSPNSLFNQNNFPQPWTNSTMWNPWNNGNNSNMPFFPQSSKKTNNKAWGNERNIWPDFYTGFTEDFWDQSINAPYDVGRMPGGWRAPSLNSPDPATVGDAVINQFPPMMDEMGNMMNFSN